MVKENKEVVYKPGKVILPPEIKDIISSEIEDYPALIKYEEHKEWDVIGKYKSRKERKLPHPHSADIPYIYLYGDTSQVHRWGVDLDENDFFKQIDTLKELSAQKAIYHTVVGVRRTNIFRLKKIYDLINDIRGRKVSQISLLDVSPLKGLKERFYKYLNAINAKTMSEGIEFKIIDPKLEELLTSINKIADRADYKENDFLRALGVICKDVFIGPHYLLFDLAGRCNLDCVYCRKFSAWNKAYWETHGHELSGFMESKTIKQELSGFMDFETIKNILLEAKELGTKNILYVGGGEPTLHPDFRKIIDLTEKLGMGFNFSTNGSLLNLYNNDLISSRCDGVTVSLSFASNKSFQLIHPRSDTKIMRKMEENVKELARLKKKHHKSLPHIKALYAICKYNYKEILKMAIHAKKLGADSIWYQLVHLENFSRDMLYMDKGEMENVKILLKRARILCKSMGLGFNSFIDFEMRHYDKTRGDWSKGGLLQQGCFVGWHFAFIHLRREVFMCCGGKAIGILDKQGRGLKDLWFSDTYSRYRNDGLIMHKENPITLYGKPLYEAFCDSCDNHDQNVKMINLIKQYGLDSFVER